VAAAEAAAPAIPAAQSSAKTAISSRSAAAAGRFHVRTR
jgi:hypothetical protein